MSMRGEGGGGRIFANKKMCGLFFKAFLQTEYSLQIMITFWQVRQGKREIVLLQQNATKIGKIWDSAYVYLMGSNICSNMINIVQ